MSADTVNEPSGEAHVGADVTPQFKHEVRQAAARRGMSMANYIRLALRRQMDHDEDIDFTPE